MEKNQPDDLPILTENVHFKPEEMIRCAKCERANPPNRVKCLYCAAVLEISEAQSKYLQPNLRKLEKWEKGWNVIFSSASRDADLAAAARLLKIELEFLQKIVKASCPLPVARVESAREAEILQTRLSEFEIETSLVSDENLAFDQPPRRLRGIEFFDDRLILILFNQDETVEINADDLALIVAGAVFERKISATEKYSKKGENQILDTSETASDEVLLDVFARQDALGFRIFAKGFDFSSLEAEKGILAKDNLKTLAAKLSRFAPAAKFVDDYLPNRSLLAGVWEVEQTVDSQGLKREGFGKFNVGNITTVNNTSQFTKYSRLQWQLL